MAENEPQNTPLDKAASADSERDQHDAEFRKQIRRERSKIARKVEKARVAGKQKNELSRHTAEDELHNLQRVVEKHRLMFLYFACPRRLNPANPSEPIEKVEREDHREHRIPTEAIESTGEFLFAYQGVLNTFAQAATARFGTGAGVKPREYVNGEFVEIDRSSLPVWELDEIACHHLEDSSDRILDACKALSKSDTDRRYQSLVKSGRDLVHDDGQSRWYSSVLVRWDYLARLDGLIAAVKTAEIDYGEAGTSDQNHGNGAGGASQASATQGRKTNVDPISEAEMQDFLQKIKSLTQDEQSYIVRFSLFMYAQIYHNLVEAVAVSDVCWVDLELNAWYLQIVKAIKDTLAMSEFAGFPGGFEPIATNLFPGNDLDAGWEDCIGPPVMDFVSRAQAFFLEVRTLPSTNHEFVKSIIGLLRSKGEEASRVARRHREQAKAAFAKMLKRVQPTPSTTDSLGDAGHQNSASSASVPAETTRVVNADNSSPDALRDGVQAKLEAKHSPPSASSISESPMAMISGDPEDAIQSLLQSLVRIDQASMNFGVLMHRLRTENLHGAFSETCPAALTFAQVKEIKDRLAAATQPIRDAIAQAKPACDGIARHLSDVIDNPKKWETDLRTNLRLLSEAVCGFSMTVPSSLREEAEINGLTASLYAQGTHLQDAYQTIAASLPKGSASGNREQSIRADTAASGNDALSALVEDANVCLMTLGDMRRDYLVMSSLSQRIVGGGEDWHFDNPADEHEHRDASRRVKDALEGLSEPLARVIAWGASKGVEVPSARFPFDARATSGVLADIAAEYEMAVRSILGALTIEQAKQAVKHATEEGGVRTGEQALEHLQAALERHRLTFLFCAWARRLVPIGGASKWESLERDEYPDKQIPSNAFDESGEFLLKYSEVLNRYAQAAIGRFGPGAGVRASVWRDGQHVDVEGASLPVWSLDELDCMMMEQASNALLDACRALARLDSDKRFRRLLRRVRDVAYDEGQSRWYSSVLVKWNYLSRLDDAISAIKVAELDLVTEASDRSKVKASRNTANGGTKTVKKTRRKKGKRRAVARSSTVGQPTPQAKVLLLASVPALNTTDGSWVRCKLAARLEGVQTRTLATYRSQGESTPDKMGGRDPQRRFWRRQGTPRSHPWYLKSSLPSQAKA